MFLIFISALFITQGEASPGRASDAWLIGRETEYSAALIGDAADGLYAIQLTSRGGRLCQVRAFFHAEEPRAAQFCAGRVVARHVRDAGIAMLAEDEFATSLSACLTPRGHVAALRFAAAGGRSVTAPFRHCDATGFVRVDCAEGWSIQGLDLYFDGAPGRFTHRRLVGIRPLCMKRG